MLYNVDAAPFVTSKDGQGGRGSNFHLLAKQLPVNSPNDFLGKGSFPPTGITLRISRSMERSKRI